MSFRATSQDSRDPNSPQWGYLKVKDPENELCYPAKDKNWNEYVLFVYNTDNPIEDVTDPETGGILARKDLKCVMVPAKLTINCDIDQVLERTRNAMETCKGEKRKRYKEYCKRLEHIQKTKLPKKITIDGNNSSVPESTSLWVALVIGSNDDNGGSKAGH